MLHFNFNFYCFCCLFIKIFVYFFRVQEELGRGVELDLKSSAILYTNVINQLSAGIVSSFERFNR